MKKLLPLTLLLIATCAQAQTSPPSVLPDAEVLKYRRQHDSTLIAQAKRRKEIQAYNSEYDRTHPVKKPASKPAKKRS